MVQLARMVSIERLRMGSRGKRGQIAMLLMLTLIGILVFAVAIANLGVSATMASTVANAADAAALQLGSDLASKSHGLNESLKTVKGKYEAGPPPKTCVKKAGFGLTILAVVAAAAAAYFLGPLVAPLLAPTLTGTAATIVAGALVGAAAGGITGASFGAGTGTGALSGGLQGAQVGAMTGAAIGAGGEGFGTWQDFLPMFENPEFVASTAGMAAGGTASFGINLYSDFEETRQQAAAVRATAVDLSGLDEPEQFRERAMLEAFRRTVDDPNTREDTCDADIDGDTDEDMSRFQHFWCERTKALKAAQAEVATRVTALLKEFRDLLASFALTTQTFNLEQLARRDIEGADGRVVELARLLEHHEERLETTNDQDVPVAFWDDGPTAQALAAWLNDPNEDVPPPEGYDSLDHAVALLQGFAHAVDGDGIGAALQEGSGLAGSASQALGGGDGEGDGGGGWLELTSAQLFGTRHFWATPSIEFYGEILTSLLDGEPPAEPGDPPFLGLRQWREELVDVRDHRVPPCGVSEMSDGITITHAPCAISADRRAELQRELANVQAFLGMIRSDGAVVAGTPLHQDILLHDPEAANAPIRITALELRDGAIHYEYNGTPPVDDGGGGGDGGDEEDGEDGVEGDPGSESAETD